MHRSLSSQIKTQGKFTFEEVIKDENICPRAQAFFCQFCYRREQLKEVDFLVSSKVGKRC